MHTHGIIFAELKKFVVARHGAKAWNDIVAAAELRDRVFLPNQSYGDADAVRIVTEASRLTGQPAAAILEDFGDFIAGDLLAMYRTQLDPSWKALEVIEHTEELIHRVVRMQMPGARPPELTVQRRGPQALVLTYASARRMCGVAKGLARGIGRAYQQRVEVSEPACMLQGAKACEIHVRLA